MDVLILDDQFDIELESTRIKLFGQTFCDAESDTNIVIDAFDIDAYNELHEYYNNVSDIYYRFKDSYGELTLALKLLELFDHAVLKENGIKKSQYLTYHIKFWHIKIATTFDLIIKLIGSVYDLRITDRFINLRIIENNKYINATPAIVAHLKKLKGLIESEIRNKIIHQQLFENSLLLELKISDLFFELPIEFNDEVENNVNVQLINKYYTKSKLFTEALNSLTGSLSLIFVNNCKNKEDCNRK